MEHQDLKISIVHYSDFQRENLFTLFNEMPFIELVYNGNFVKKFQDGMYSAQTDVVFLSEKQFGKDTLDVIDELLIANPIINIVLIVDELLYPLPHILQKGIIYLLSESNLVEDVNLFFANYKRCAPYISRFFTKDLLDLILKDEPKPAEQFYLPEKTYKTLELLAKGQSYESIACTLNMTLDSVRFHIKKIYVKLGVKNKVDAVNKFYNSKIEVGVYNENRGRKKKIALET